MRIRSIIRKVLKWAAALSFIVFAIGAASILIIGADNNPFLLYPPGEVDLMGPLNFIVFIALGAIFFVSLALLAVLNLFEWLFVSNNEQTSPHHTVERGHTDAPKKDLDPEEQYLYKFQKYNFYIGGVLAAVLGLYMIVESAAGNSAPGIVNIVYGLLHFAITIFGGFTSLLIITAVFLGVWYGLKNQATEALIVGIVAWGLIAIVGLGFVTSSTSGFGLIIAGLYGVYYGVKSRGSTESFYVEHDMVNDF